MSGSPLQTGATTDAFTACPERESNGYPMKRSSLTRIFCFYAAFLSIWESKDCGFTGENPLSGKGFVPFLGRFAGLYPGLRVAVTTNGSFLDEFAGQIALLGLDSLNVSLDTLDAVKFRRVSRTGCLEAVVRGIDAVVRHGGPFLKLNAVIMKGFNDGEIPGLMRFAEDRNSLLRLIEFMPLDGQVWSRAGFVPAEEMIDMLPDRDLWQAVPGEAKTSCGPSRYYENKRTGQKIGIISAVSDHFCGSCNRLRISSVGEVLPCLFSSSGVFRRCREKGQALARA